MFIALSTKLCSDVLLDSVPELLKFLERRRSSEPVPGVLSDPDRTSVTTSPTNDVTNDFPASQDGSDSHHSFGESLISQCTKIKHEYDSCFFNWYQNEYLPNAESKQVTDPCSGILQQYRTCLQSGIVDAGVIDLQTINIDIPEGPLESPYNRR
eukprot:m.150902 g.150902  ORF g.150902 m.150902 type:complete len:154 (-) comp17839_c0_seq2:613-1074(-)